MNKWIPFFSFYDDEGIETVTSKDQKNTEMQVFNQKKSEFYINRNNIRDYLISIISSPPNSFHQYSSQEPWIPYHFILSFSLLSFHKLRNIQLFKEACSKYIFKRQSKYGGYGPSPHEIGHVALTYTSINTIALTLNEANFQSIDRHSLYNWFMSLKQPNGSFSSSEGYPYECDTRSTYCVISVASLLNILTPELTKNTAAFLSSCQGYDGGFGPIPGSETHGGYGFCALAALDLLGALDTIDANSAIKWCSMRQMPFCGGFNGRTNKLVDTCYTWWVGAMCKILSDRTGTAPFWNDEALATYVLTVCQNVDGSCGGFKDKPGKKVDMFHTMYGLAGLSAACRNLIKEKTGFELEEMDARYCVTKAAAEMMKSYFAAIPFEY
ncbi:Prenyltransferase and squalene oxidase repeat family protein [Histomonas meleagridis]|uniref:Prenyltransferase and squalene oxidase repeat family protein n=1 Tax=Histomonas meleagridis TaxID=135588 RepID=UPI003559E659|nr:Prenyltransferase and squalene oxidase repeat family protein [Histomonas meleagridis]KAH0799800.1 Prenyltransferase and squalene oxidase repeat family protein [Histomonas meleagridis]